MKRSIVHVFLSAVMLLCVSAWASAASAAAFPGAAGFGTATAGGRGGKVIFVTNLNDSGSGSFRAAIEASGPRLILFRTGGTIRLSRDVVVRNPYVTIAGQTAPGGGISLRGAALTVVTHDVVVRGLRIRVGDDPTGPDPDNRDALQLDNMNGTLYNVVVDHCSVSWAIDENISIWHEGAHDLTISHSISSEALNNSLHSKGPHSKGLIVGIGSRNVTLYGNLLAHNDERNPLVQGSNIEIINNVVYDRGKKDVEIGSDTEPQYINVIGNYFKKGPGWWTNPYPIFIRYNIDLPAGSLIRASDNIGNGYGSLYNNSTFLTDKNLFTASNVTAKPASEVFNWVLANVGANPQRPDPVDARVISETRNGSGHIIDRVADVGGWPTLAAGTSPVDSDGDGMPDSWEKARALNPNYAADANSDRDNDGYTNIEEYINSFYSGGAAASLQPPVLRIISKK